MKGGVRGSRREGHGPDHLEASSTAKADAAANATSSASGHGGGRFVQFWPLQSLPHRALLFSSSRRRPGADSVSGGDSTICGKRAHGVHAIGSSWWRTSPEDRLQDGEVSDWPPPLASEDSPSGAGEPPVESANSASAESPVSTLSPDAMATEGLQIRETLDPEVQRLTQPDVAGCSARGLAMRGQPQVNPEPLTSARVVCACGNVLPVGSAAEAVRGRRWRCSVAFQSPCLLSPG